MKNESNVLEYLSDKKDHYYILKKYFTSNKKEKAEIISLIEKSLGFQNYIAVKTLRLAFLVMVNSLHPVARFLLKKQVYIYAIFLLVAIYIICSTVLTIMGY